MWWKDASSTARDPMQTRRSIETDARQRHQHLQGKVDTGWPSRPRRAQPQKLRGPTDLMHEVRETRTGSQP